MRAVGPSHSGSVSVSSGELLPDSESHRRSGHWRIRGRDGRVRAPSTLRLAGDESHRWTWSYGSSTPRMSRWGGQPGSRRPCHLIHRSTEDFLPAYDPAVYGSYTTPTDAAHPLATEVEYAESILEQPGG